MQDNYRSPLAHACRGLIMVTATAAAAGRIQEVKAICTYVGDEAGDFVCIEKVTSFW